jgi:hypothetical protein
MCAIAIWFLNGRKLGASSAVIHLTVVLVRRHDHLRIVRHEADEDRNWIGAVLTVLVENSILSAECSRSGTRPCLLAYFAQRGHEAGFAA